MSQLIYVSRNYVEFGPFKPEEIADFKSRGIIIGSDYLRGADSDSWIPAEQWDCEAPAPAPEPEAAPKKAKAPSKKKSSAKKAA